MDIEALAYDLMYGEACSESIPDHLDADLARAILDIYETNLQQYDECKAEAGMGAVSMGYDGYDGMSVYAQTHDAPQVTPLIKLAQEVVRENAPMFEAVALVTVDTSDDLPF